MDRLSIINNALFATGNDAVNTADGSDEYRVANGAFERYSLEVMASHPWLFATTIDALSRAPDTENKSRRYPYNAFRLPPDRLLVRTVYRGNSVLTEYEILGDILSCHYDSEIYAAVVKATSEERWHPVVISALTLYVEAGILRGLNEDFTEASRRESRADALLVEARPAVDQQNPGRNLFHSRIAEARRTRRV